MGVLIEIILGSLILGVIFICLVLFLGARLISGGSGGEEREAETRMIQEIYQGLNRMEQRVETLETILLDLEKKEERR